MNIQEVEDLYERIRDAEDADALRTLREEIPDEPEDALTGSWLFTMQETVAGVEASVSRMMGIGWRALSSSLVVLIHGWGCVGGEVERSPYVSFDSGGATVVSSETPLLGPESLWRAHAAPVLEFGGDPEGDLHDVRAVRKVSNDRIAFYNRSTCEIRIVDLVGRPIRQWGRCGNGPGEFGGYFWGIWNWRGDSLLVADGFPGRLSVYSRQGQLGRLTTLSHLSELPLARPVGLIEDGVLLRNDELTSGPLGVQRLDVELATSDLAGGDLHRIGTFVSRTVETFDFQGATGIRPLLFSGRTAVVAGTDEIFVGLPDSYEIRAYRGDGTLSRIIRRAFEPVIVEDRDIHALVDKRLAELEGSEWSEREVRDLLWNLNRTDVMPAFGVPEWPGLRERAGPPMLVDDAGNLWVFDYYRPGEYANRWTIFDPEGAWLTSAELPDRFIPTHIGEDFVLGHWIDDLGLTHIRLYELEK